MILILFFIWARRRTWSQPGKSHIRQTRPHRRWTTSKIVQHRILLFVNSKDDHQELAFKQITTFPGLYSYGIRFLLITTRSKHVLRSPDLTLTTATKSLITAPNGMIYKGSTKAQRAQILQKAHVAHFGPETNLASVRTLFFVRNEVWHLSLPLPW